MSRFNKYFSVIVGGMLLLGASCVNNNSYQKQVSFTTAEWSSEDMPVFEYEITDTTATYQSQLLLRHDDTYPFSNIWVKIYMQKPSDSTYTDSFHREVTLADNEGYWLGDDQGAMWVYRIPITSSKLQTYPSAGMYKVRIKQLMRKDPLPAVLNVGWRVDKIAP